jgi:hypothetical protein
MGAFPTAGKERRDRQARRPVHDGVGSVIVFCKKAEGIVVVEGQKKFYQEF